MNDFTGEIKRLKALVEARLCSALPEIDSCSKTLADSMYYSLGAQGKRIRPVLLLLSCKAMSGDENEALPYACAIEYIHNYSLIHDDLPAMDDDDLRRGKATNHIVYGEAIAILAGDGLLTSAFEVMNFDLMLHFDDPSEMRKRILAMHEIAKGAGCRGMIGGQLADIEAETKSISPELLDYIHLNKTAALIRASVRAGAMIGGADNKLRDALSVYGENLGLAFQVADDILDVTGTDERLGKHTGQDNAAEKPTYPSIHGVEASVRRLNELTETAVQAISGFDDRMIDFFIELARVLAKRDS